MKQAYGFTLLELLIGLTLLSFILTLLFSGFRLAINSWDAVENHVQHDSQQQSSIALLRRLLGALEPVRQKRLTGQPLAFAGHPNRLVMVSLLTEQVGLRTIELSIESQEGEVASTLRLVLRDGPLPYESMRLIDLVTDVNGRTLIDGLQSARFHYFGSLRPGEEAGWHDVWESADALPALVHVKFIRKDDVPIDLMVATMISADRNAVVRITAGPPQ